HYNLHGHISLSDDVTFSSFVM
uniref:Biopterin-dependent aromatic amino acid hydroxylase family profile domain-containing protein n=1 Tax=Amphimedon queenslandica TaxID=400682 RepID=A0A1X7V6C8_AMPQE